MKIAILSFYSGHLDRGVETWTKELASRLSTMCKVVVYQNGPAIENVDYEIVSIGLEVDWQKNRSYIPFFGYWSFLVKKFTEKVLKIIDNDVDIVISTNGQWQSLLTKIWCLKNSKKLVICGHSGPGIDDRINLLFFPDRFVALTEFQKKWAQRVNPFIKVSKIYNGVDLKIFDENNVKPKVKKRTPIILSVGAFDIWKRQNLIVEAVSKLKTGSVFLVGKGSGYKGLQTLCKRILPGRFKIASVPYERMSGVYKTADVFVYATIPWESFGIVLLEAMASNIPVVCTDDPIRKEIVGNAGIFVNPTNTTALADSIKRALDIDWGDKPRKQAEKFSWDVIVNKYIDLFNSVVQ